MLIFVILLACVVKSYKGNVIEINTSYQALVSDAFYFGSNCQGIAITFSINDADIFVADGKCDVKSQCPKYCNIQAFCNEFCNPLCCLSLAEVNKRCDYSNYSSYDRNSTSFSMTSEYIQSNGLAGILVKDDIHFLTTNNSYVSFYGKSFYLQVKWLLDNYVVFGSSNKIGLGLSRKRSNFLQDLYAAKQIARSVATISWHKDTIFPSIIFGDYNDKYCTGGWKYLTPVDETTWMFDANQFEFVTIRRSYSYRLMFSEFTPIRIPVKHVQQLLYESKLHFLAKGLYVVEDKGAYNYTWSLKSTTISVKPIGSKTDSILVQPLQPNPDNLQFILGFDLFYKYCLALDYGRKQMALADCEIGLDNDI
ncbi:unnamed protein product [Bursaphelenchus okinawaensis]|uniref:Peptidase A1 domain-containing protein n=1 Tax=Bursaphelenchus okinawaensis TaxID=465554 RepID=A0A811L0I2_9BILA|nr:unnamed protein product [Bursaphelenchus okinawaensis]CAG9113985.1 unnamed protein product [Bursaphelenchus okinawaensis]